MRFYRPGTPLKLEEVKRPSPASHQVLLEVEACGVCRTDLHIVDGELEEAETPLIPGHQIVGTIRETGDNIQQFESGDRVGVPWLGATCDQCYYCTNGMENLCENARFTGYTLDGGFAEYAVAHENYSFPIADDYPATQAAPLLCAGLIGYRSLRMTGEADKIGFYGFGAAAHVLIQVTRHRDKDVYAFTRPGDTDGQEFARKKGAVWAGGSDTAPPDQLDAAIIFAPAGHLVPEALKAVRPGGRVVCAGIHMSDIPQFPYKLLWEERSIHSVANLTRKDGEEFLQLAPQIPIRTEVTPYQLSQTNRALDDLRHGNFNGSAVIDLGLNPERKNNVRAL